MEIDTTIISPEDNFAIHLHGCLEKYLEGYTNVSRETRPKLWFFYFQFLYEQLKTGNCGDSYIFMHAKLLGALHEGEMNGFLTQQCYQIWVEVLEQKESAELIKRGTIGMCNTISIWKQQVYFHMVHDVKLEVDEAIKMGITNSIHKSLVKSLWSTYVNYHFLNIKNKEYIIVLTKEGVKYTREISENFMPRFLELQNMFPAMHKARQAYKDIKTKDAPCPVSLNIMMSIPVILTNTSFYPWHFMYKLVCEQFSDIMEVWIAHIELYLLYNNKMPNLMKRVEEIYNHGKFYLPESVLDKYTMEYEHIKMVSYYRSYLTAKYDEFIQGD